MTHVLLLGSGPDVVRARGWARRPFDAIVAINNAWRVRSDWDYLIHPYDFPSDRMPVAIAPGQQIVDQDDFVPAQNEFGGFVYAGGTMAFTAGYWALSALKPATIAFLGCDMTYAASGQTHFYGTGTPDPLRKDITLRSLESKSARMMVMAAMQGCAMVNLSEGPSRLILPRTTPDRLAGRGPVDYCPAAAARALDREAALGYLVPSGRYWEHGARFDPDAIDALDAMWLRAARPDAALSA